MPSLSGAPVSAQTRKRYRSDTDLLERPPKSHCISLPPQGPPSLLSVHSPEEKSLSKLSSFRMRHGQDAEPEATQNNKRKRSLSSAASDSVQTWVLGLPPQFDSLSQPSGSVSEDWDEMSGAPSKRVRSESNVSERSWTGDGETNTTLSRDAKYSIYKNPRYPAVMESKGSFMRDSEGGLLPEELEMLKAITTKKTTLPKSCTLPPTILVRLREMLRHRSELRVCIDLHPYLVPSAELLALLYPDEIQDLAEGHNDRWLDNLVFYSKLPQPDRTLAFSLSAFTEIERRKLQLSPETKSSFLACHRTLFPFFTVEVKCGKDELETADNANTNSMTIAQRAVFELYHAAGQASKIHRRVLGFSLSHNEGAVRIYAHYPEIDGDKITFYRKTLREFSYADDDAKEGETAAQFVWNVYTCFAPLHLKRLKEAIGWLRDPLSPSANSQTPSETPTPSGDVVSPPTPITLNSEATFAKPGPIRRHNSTTVAHQVESQHQEIMVQFRQLQKTSKEREDKLLAQMQQQQAQMLQQQIEARKREENLQNEAKEREDKLQKRIEEQHTQLMKILTEKLAPAQSTEKTS